MAELTTHMRVLKRTVEYEIWCTRRVLADRNFQTFVGLATFWAAGTIAAILVGVSLLAPSR